MKIDVIIPSRGNPLRLMSVITAFDALTTGLHEVTYRVVCDMDDEQTQNVSKPLLKVGLPVAVHIGTGPLSARMNEAAREGNADIVSGAADDTFPLTQNWDETLNIGMSTGHTVFSWQEMNDPTNTTMLVFARTWLESTGRMLPEYFPFWFGDTWVAEVYEMAFLRPLPVIANLPWGGKRGKTKGMRDLAFWFDFFAATRIERIAEARGICFAYDQPFEMPSGMLQDMKKRDAEQLEKAPSFSEWYGADIGEPTDLYISMKANAEQWLREHQ